MAAMRRACCADVARSLGGGDKPHTYGWILNTLVRVEANHKYRPSLHNQPACTASAPRPRLTTTQLAIPKRQYDRGRAPLRTIEVKRWIVCLQLGRCPIQIRKLVVRSGGSSLDALTTPISSVFPKESGTPTGSPLRSRHPCSKLRSKFGSLATGRCLMIR